jgi:hypothetical protein
MAFEKGHERLAVRPSFGYVFWQFLPGAIGAGIIGWLVAQGFSVPAQSAELHDGERARPAPFYPVVLALLAAAAVAAGAFASTLRLRRAHVFDKGEGVLRCEHRPICPLTAIRRLEIEPTTPSGSRAALAQPYYRLHVCYATGSVYLFTRASHLGREFLFEFDSREQAYAAAREIARFIGVPSLDRDPAAVSVRAAHRSVAVHERRH